MYIMVTVVRSSQFMNTSEPWEDTAVSELRMVTYFSAEYEKALPPRYTVLSGMTMDSMPLSLNAYDSILRKVSGRVKFLSDVQP